MTPRFAPAALRDLEAIDDYTADRWGQGQARRYAGDLLRACDRIAANPRLGRVWSGNRSLSHYRVASHHVFYRAGEDHDVEIVRVLHQAMDFAARLRGR